MIIAVQAVFLRMFIAHLLGDFYLQKDEWVEDKRKNVWKSNKLYLHSLVIAVITYVFSGLFTALWILPLVFVTHALIDILKVYIDGSGNNHVFSFVFDQILHIFVLLGITFIIGYYSGSDVTAFVPAIFENPVLLAILAAYLIVITPSGFLISCALKPVRNQVDASENKCPGSYNNLNDAGRLIGYLERVLVLTFVFINQYAAIGFLITAKSIFRFREDKPYLVEYYLLGTFLSMTMVILVGLATILLVSFVSSGSLNELPGVFNPVSVVSP